MFGQGTNTINVRLTYLETTRTTWYNIVPPQHTTALTCCTTKKQQKAGANLFAVARRYISPSLSVTDCFTDLWTIVASLPAMIYTYTVNHETGASNLPYVSDYREQIFGIPASGIVGDAEKFVNLLPLR